MPKQTEKDPTQALRKLALGYPETQHELACKGTAVESSSYKARGKAFLFISGAEPSYTVRVKLGDSQAEVKKLAAKEPEHYQLGAHGWTKVTFSAAKPPPAERMAKWIAESYRLVAMGKVV